MIDAGVSGLGWFVHHTCEFDKIVMHGGAWSGATSQVALLPDEGVGVVVLRNVSPDATSNPLDLSRDILLALKKTGGLAERVPRPRTAPFDALMPKILALYDRWDEAAYRALWSPRRSLTLAAENEREVLASLRAMHGACKGYTVKQVIDATKARFALQCQRGALDLIVSIDPVDGLLHRHLEASSRDVPPPAELGRIAGQLAGLIGAWDDMVFARHLAAKGRRTRDESAAAFALLRAGHGSCRVKAYERWTDSQDRSTRIGWWWTQDRFALSCERGADLALDLRLEEGNPENVLRYTLDPMSNGGCPKL
jgi:hypothetical protein